MNSIPARCNLSRGDTNKDAYSEFGVVPITTDQGVLKEMCRRLGGTWSETVLLEFGYFANVIRVSEDLGIAISTDGVGTKIIIAEMMDKYDTIGIDCVAMNVNDVICVGATPVSMVDYIAVQKASKRLLLGITEGLIVGAERANISIPGGEIAQVREMIRGSRKDHGFDLVGTCIGTVNPSRLVIGDGLKSGDTVIGIRSNGIHSNGMTLARRVLLEEAGLRLDQHIDELGTSLGEELLAPTHIYVEPVLKAMESGIDVKALIHVTSEGFLNLLRIKSRREIGFVIDELPEPHPIFELIRTRGKIDNKEMFHVYNMGIGFCFVVAEADVQQILDIVQSCGFDGSIIGYVDAERKNEVHIPSYSLVGKDGRFD